MKMTTVSQLTQSDIDHNQATVYLEVHLVLGLGVEGLVDDLVEGGHHTLRQRPTDDVFLHGGSDWITVDTVSIDIYEIVSKFYSLS